MSGSKGTLSWSMAWKIAWRDLHTSWIKFAFVVLAVALGVGSLTGMRSFSSLFERTLLDQARVIMAADLSAQDFHPFSATQLAALDQLSQMGVQHTLVTETVSMASTTANPDPLLVALKVVDPAQYPYYGRVQLDSGQPLREVLHPDTAIVSEEFLLRMHTHPGDTLHLGKSQFRIVDVVRSEPDRISSSFGIGPRVMISQAALAATGLILPGSRANERMLFRLPAKGPSVDALRRQVETILPEAQITDYREANPALVEGLHRSTAMLTLVSLVTLVLSAIGVAMAMRAHMRQRLETIAIMKSLGARSAQVMRIYVLQTLFLGLLGALGGILAGSLVARVFPVLLGRLIALPVEGHLALGPVLVGLFTGILTTLLFTLPPLIEIRSLRPLRILRRSVESEPARRGLRRFIPRDRLQWLTALVISLGLAGIAGSLTGSSMVGGWFAAGLSVTLLFLLMAAAAMLWLVRRLLRRNRHSLSPVMRQGLANLSRPGNQSAAVLTALGVGVMLIMTVYSMQRAIVLDLHSSDASHAPNVFLVDIGSEELPGISRLLNANPSVRGGLETIPIVSSSVVSLDGIPVAQLKLPHYPHRLLQSTSLTWAEKIPAGETVTSGHWWKDNQQILAGSQDVPVAVSEHTARLLHVHPGSRMVFAIGETQISARVAALYHSDGQHLYARSQFILPPSSLRDQPVVWYAAFHAVPSAVGSIERALFAAYPTVTVINVADVMQTIGKVVDQIAAIVRFLAAFTMLAGGIILASSVTATRFERTREVAIFKSLGALRHQIISIFTVEFIVLGGIAGLAGVLFSLALSAILLHKLEVAFRPGWPMSIIAIFGTAILSSAVGWAASARILEQKPLEVLREE